MSPEESGYYAQLFSQVDVDGQGRLGGLQAADFFSRSGLDRRTLKQIWDIADSQTQGFLVFEEFAAALRLVAHAQAGRAVSKDLVYVAPPGPPWFDSGPPPPSSAARPLATQPPAVRRGRSPARGSEDVPSSRDLRKYGRLFERVTAGRALLNAAAARDLFSRSSLQTDVLARIWDLSDADRDSHLSWPEFVVSMHLIRLARKGRALPQALPMELVACVAGLGPSDFYARQASRLPRALSAAGSAIFDESRSRSPAGTGQPDASAALASGYAGSYAGGSAASMPPSSNAAMPPSVFNTTLDAAGLGFDEAPKAARSIESDSGKAPAAGSPAFESPPASPPQQSRQLPWEAEGPPSPPQQTRSVQSDEQHASPEFGQRGHFSDVGSSLPSLPRRDTQPVEHLEVLIEAEKKLVHQLRFDTDELNEDLDRLEEACRVEEKEAARERSESEHIASERRHLQQQLEASHLQLRTLKAERQELHVESILLRRDQCHYGGELAFLQKLLDEGLKDTQALQESIAYLEQSSQSLASHTRSLEEARREVQRQVREEKELLRKEQEAALKARQALETLASTSTSGFSPAFQPTLSAQ